MHYRRAIHASTTRAIERPTDERTQPPQHSHRDPDRRFPAFPCRARTAWRPAQTGWQQRIRGNRRSRRTRRSQRSRGLGDLGGALSGQSVTSGSASNVAGLLEFCIKNNYLGGDKAAAVKDSLTSKLPGGSSSSDGGYKSGKNGILSSGDGSTLDLSGGGMKKQVTKQICDKVLDQGKSLL
jgi:hypothetical protein